MGLPANISYGTVVGQFLAAVADGNDADELPDSVAMSGTVVFIASPGYVIDYTATPNPVVIVKTAITCRLDSSGYLCSPYPDDNSKRGVTLVATDDPDLNPVGWTWNVIYNLTDPQGKPVAMPNQSIQVPTGATVDLATVMPIGMSNGQMIIKGDPNVLTVGTVTSGNDAAVTISGQSPNQTINFVLPETTPAQQAFAIAMAIAL